MPAERAGMPFFPFRAGAAVFVHLHCHSHYSFLRGVASPEEIIAAAVEQKMLAVALTDTNGLYAAVQFYKLAQEAKVKPIVGVTLDVQSPFDPTPGKRVTSGEWRERTREISRYARNDGNKPSTTLVLLATNMEGYSNLCQLVTLRHLGTTKLSQNMNSAETDGRVVTLQELAEHICN
jgi:DNA polymerase III alpha subunit